MIDRLFGEHYEPILTPGKPAFGFGCKVAGYSAEALTPAVWAIDFRGAEQPAWKGR